MWRWCSLCSEGRWRCTTADCNAAIACPGELVHRTDIGDCNSTCDRLDDCDPDTPLRSGCACPDGLFTHPQVKAAFHDVDTDILAMIAV